MNYELSLHRDYRNHWSVNDAIREVLQNALDDESTFSFGNEDDTISIRSEGVTLCQSSLLLGNTSKGEDSGSVGGFGEGYKIALLILCRNGYDVRVENGDKLWTPYFNYSDSYKCEVLNIKEEEIEDTGNLSFIIKGVDNDIKDAMIEKCLYLQDDLGEVIETYYGRILKDVEGKLYVGGLFVTDTQLKFSYDFNPSELQLNTDRQSVSGWDLEWAVAKMWNDTDDMDFVAQLVYDKCIDVIRINAYRKPELISSCMEVYKEEYGENTPIAEDTHDQRVMEQSEGFKGVVVTGNSTFTDLVTNSDSYNSQDFDKDEVDERSPVEILWECFHEIENQGTEEITLALLEGAIELLNERGVSWDG